MARQEILDRVQKYVHPFRVTEGKGFRLQDFDPGDTLGLKLDKGEASELLARGTAWLAEERSMYFRQRTQRGRIALLNTSCRVLILRVVKCSR